MTVQHADFEFIELYITYNFAEAQVIEDLLKANHIICAVRNLAPAQFPIGVGKHGQIRIAVQDSRVEDATALLRQAIEDDAITDQGKFMFDD